MSARALSGRTVLLFHGSQKDISYYVPHYRFLHDAGPIFFLHGEHDFDLDLRATLSAYRAAPGRSQLWILPGAGHAPDSLQVHDGEYQAAVMAFLADAFAGKSPPIECAWEPGDGHVQVTRPGRRPTGRRALRVPRVRRLRVRPRVARGGARGI